jgi:hypothetical protein
MHIASTTHERGTSAKVYTYEADFEIGADAITWKASIREGSTQLDPIAGSIPLTSLALPMLAEQAVRDEIVKRIDSFDDARSAP